jgi:hypothetical protein
MCTPQAADGCNIQRDEYDMTTAEVRPHTSKWGFRGPRNPRRAKDEEDKTTVPRSPPAAWP